METMLKLVTGCENMKLWLSYIRQARNVCRRRRLICEALGHPDAELYKQISVELDDILFRYSAYSYS